jgi:hypothetical protein
MLRDGAALDPSAALYSVLPAGHALGYQDAFNAFVADTYRTVRGEVVDGLPVFRDGLRAAVLTQAILDSNRTGEWAYPSRILDAVEQDAETALATAAKSAGAQ